MPMVFHLSSRCFLPTGSETPGDRTAFMNSCEATSREGEKVDSCTCGMNMLHGLRRRGAVQRVISPNRAIPRGRGRAVALLR